MEQLIEYLLHIDIHLFAFVSQYGTLAYAVLFLVIFCETGLVITPFLPGDSLLFAAGSLSANQDQPLRIQLLFLLLLLAAILGNKLNYIIGRTLGTKMSAAPHHWLFQKKHLAATHAFYEKHGGKALVISRFIPIIRTFAPFVAGISTMPLRRFSLYNIISGLLWVGTLLGLGYLLGTLPFVKNNFTLAIYSIILLSLTPLCAAYFRRKLNSTN
ncbi:MAG TPA: DedA family protein [Gammaproteobacteria bacterium]|jgi:membrane-associated protein|nr:DedA family protein [Gammaproteobacteria bacterium]